MLKNLILLSVTAILFSGMAVADLEQRVERMERVVNSQGLVDMALQIERLQNEIRQLRGDIESQRYELESMKKRQRDLYLDMDRRLRSQETGTTPPVTVSPKPSIQTRTGDDTGSETAGTVSTSVNANEQVDYQNALNILREGRYAQSIEAFSNFLKKYPQSLYAANARYWVGEAHYVSREFKESMVEFQKVVDQYPESPKVADALLKIGFIHYELAEWNKARSILESVTRRFPGSTAAGLADNRLQKMRVEGR